MFGHRNSSLLSVFTRFLVLLSFDTIKELMILVDGQVAFICINTMQSSSSILLQLENDSATKCAY